MGAEGLDLDDDEWTRLKGGYKVRYDPRRAMRALELGEDTGSAWEELWTNLYHQGDVGHASYAAVPHLVRIEAARGVSDATTYSFAVTVEEARRAGHNPEVPEYLRDAYQAAWRRLVELALRRLPTADDHELCSSMLAAIAMAKGLPQLAHLAGWFDEEERRGILNREW